MVGLYFYIVNKKLFTFSQKFLQNRKKALYLQRTLIQSI